MKFSIMLFSHFFLLGCSFDKGSSDIKEEGRSYKNVEAKNDSAALLNDVIRTFNEDVLQCRDSIAKYGLTELNDSCIKYIYGVNGRDLVDTLSGIVVAQCGIKIIRFSLDNKSYNLGYALFVHDSIPEVFTWADQPLIHSFECEMVTKRIKKAYLGQHSSFTYKKDLDKWYEQSLEKSRKGDFFKTAGLHPDFIRLVGGGEVK